LGKISCNQTKRNKFTVEIEQNEEHQNWHFSRALLQEFDRADWSMSVQLMFKKWNIFSKRQSLASVKKKEIQTQ
jgi:hypothetical protein